MNLSYLSPDTEVRRSPIHGLGLFARRPIAAGAIVAVKGGHILTEPQWRELAAAMGPAQVQVAEGLFIAPVAAGQRAGAMLYLNHSCEPNCALAGQIVFLAMREVARGEELTHDWATTDDLDYAMTCNCGTPGCRGRITGKDWMRPDLQRKYAGWFCWFLQRKIDAMDRARRPDPGNPR